MIDPNIQQAVQDRELLIRQNLSLLRQQAHDEATRAAMKRNELALQATIDALQARLQEAEATMEQMALAESCRGEFSTSPIPTARGIEYAARRLRRIASKAAPHSPRLSDPWSEIEDWRRSTWRAIAIAVWCHPQTSKTLR